MATPGSPPPARDRVLDAFENQLIEYGERAATLEAVAARAEVSKGGLLYHFGSKEALAQGLLDRLDARRDEELDAIRTAEEGVVPYLLRTSLSADSPFDRSILATARLAQGSNERAKEALARLHDGWFAVVSEVVDDSVAARAIVLMSDGLYYNSMLLPSDSAVASITDRDGSGLDALVELARDLVDARASKAAPRRAP